MLEEIEGLSNKRALDEIEEMSVGTFVTVACEITSKKVCNGDKNDTLQVESIQGAQSPLAPE